MHRYFVSSLCLWTDGVTYQTSTFCWSKVNMHSSTPFPLEIKSSLEFNNRLDLCLLLMSRKGSPMLSAVLRVGVGLESRPTGPPISWHPVPSAWTVADIWSLFSFCFIIQFLKDMSMMTVFVRGPLDDPKKSFSLFCFSLSKSLLRFVPFLTTFLTFSYISQGALELHF